MRPTKDEQRRMVAVKKRNAISRVRAARKKGWIGVGTGLRIAITIFSAASLAFAASISVLALNNQEQDRKDQGALERERAISHEARDQFCLLAERTHREDVRSLKRTYDFLKDLKPEEVDDTLTQTIITLLPQAEREAAVDSAPSLCDRPGLGLPEPDPKLPRRPRLPILKRLPDPPREIGFERSSGSVAPETQRPTTRPAVPERPAQRPDVKPPPPSRPQMPLPQPKPAPEPPAQPPNAPEPPMTEAPKVCVTVPLDVPETCLP